MKNDSANAKSLLNHAFNRMPWRTQEALFEAYCESRGRYQVFKKLAETLNVRTLGVRGEYGEIHGGLSDESIIAAYARTGAWGDRTLSLLEDFFADGRGTYIDVGANIGLTTIPIALKKTVRCIAFEPDPRNFEYLQRNVACTLGENATIELHNSAIADQKGKLPLELSPHNLGDHRLRFAQGVSLLGEDSWATTEVQVERLDSFFDNVSQPLAVKIDVQGAEPLVIAGGVKTLGEADLVIMEFSPYWMSRMGTDPLLIVNFVRGFPKAALARGEADELGPFSSGRSVAKRLTEVFKEHKGNPIGAYWDIVCIRDHTP